MNIHKKIISLSSIITLSSSIILSMPRQKYPNTNPEQREKASTELSCGSRQKQLEKSRISNLASLDYDSIIRIISNLPYNKLLQLIVH